MNKLAIIGSRTFDDAALFNAVVREYSPDVIISGGAKGADLLAKKYAHENGVALQEFLPEYNKYKNGAPLIRNKSIVDNADRVLAFWDRESSGTKHTIDYAHKNGKVIHIIDTSKEINRSALIGEPQDSQKAKDQYLSSKPTGKKIKGLSDTVVKLLKLRKKDALEITNIEDRKKFAREFIVRHFDEKRFEKLKGRDNVYLVMPSSSGNVFPFVLAEQLKERFGGQIIENCAAQNHTSEIKKLHGIQKIFKERSYTLTDEFLASKDVLKNKNIVLVDDLVSSGRTIDTLREVLYRVNVKVDNICSLVNTFTGLVNEKKIEGLSERLEVAGVNRSEYGQKIKTLFHNSPDTVFFPNFSHGNVTEIKKYIDAEYSKRVNGLIYQYDPIVLVQRIQTEHKRTHYWVDGQENSEIRSIYMDKNGPIAHIKHQDSRLAVHELASGKVFFCDAGESIDKIKKGVEQCAAEMEVRKIMGKTVNLDLDKGKETQKSIQLELPGLDL